MSSPRSAAPDLSRHPWTVVWGLTTLAGLVLATQVWSPVTVIVGLALDTLCVTGVSLLVVACLGAAAPSAGVARRIAVRSFASVSVLAAYAALGSATSATVALLVLLAALSTSPPAVRRLARLFRGPAHDTPDEATAHRRTQRGSLFHV